MTQPARILTVCTGNVCRSPYLERRLQQEMDHAWGVGQVEVSSGGSGALVDAPMDPSSLALLSGRGGAGDDFRARQLTREMVSRADLVIVATRAHRTVVGRLFPRAMGRTHALRDLAHLARQVSDAELPAQRRDAAGWLGAVAPLVASKRGLELPLEPEDADVVDPFRQGPEVFELMQTQIEDALHDVLRVLGA